MANKTIDVEVKIRNDVGNTMSILNDIEESLEGIEQNQVLIQFGKQLAAVHRSINSIAAGRQSGRLPVDEGQDDLSYMYGIVPEIYSAYKAYRNDGSEESARRLLRLSSVGTAAENNITRASQLASKYKFDDKAQSIAQTIVEPMITSLMTQFENMNVADLVTKISRDNGYTRTLQKRGYEMTKAQVREFTEGLIRNYTNVGRGLDQIQFIESAWRKAGLPAGLVKRPQFAQDLLPNEKWITAYNSYAQHEDLAAQRQTGTNRRTLNALRQYLEETEDMKYLAPVLRQVGLLDAGQPYRNREDQRSARYRLTDNEHITSAQLDQFAGLIAQRYSNAKRSGAIWASDPTSLDDGEHLIGRNGKKVQAYQRMIDFLGQYNEITPYVDSTFVAPTRQPRFELKNQKVQQGTALEQYYIPKTYIDTRTGALVHRDFSWRKDARKGVEERDSDHFVGVGESELTRLLGMHGDGSYGLGMNSDGSYTTGRPQMIRVDMSGLFDPTSDGYRVQFTENQARKQMYMNLLDSTKSFRYQWGATPEESDEYVYAMQGDNDVIMIPKSVRDDWDRRAKEAHLPSIFQYGNYGGLVVPDSQEKTIKQINNLRKLNSTSAAFEDVYGPDARLFNAPAFVNLGAFYEMLGLDKESGFRLDGQAWGDPGIFQTSQQMRFAHGTDKFYLSALNWRPMLKALSEAYRKGEIKGMPDNSPIFGENGEIYMPTTGDKDILRMFMTGRDLNGKQMTQNEIDRMREMYFTDVMDEEIPAVIDATGMKAYEDFATMNAEDYAFYFKNQLDEAKKEGRVNADNMVQLTAQERADMIMTYARFASNGKSGYQTMKTEDELETRKDVMPESFARAIHAGEELRAESERQYNERFKSLQTLEGRINFFKNNATAMKEIEADPLWVWKSASANRQIAKEVASLEYSRAKGDLLLGNGASRVSAVAEATPGVLPEVLLYAMNYLSGKKDITDVSAMPAEWRNLLPSVMDQTNTMYAPSIKNEVLDTTTRFPSVIGAFAADVTNGAIRYNQDTKKLEIDPAYREQLIQMGRNPDDVMSILSTPQQLYRMNTGDFDGDTITAFLNLPNSAVGEAKRYLEIYQEALQARMQARIGTPEEKPKKIPAGSEVEMKAAALLYARNSRQDMASTSAVIRKMEANKADRETMLEIIKASEAYDIATSKAKTSGVQIDMDKLALTKQGATYERFLKSLKDASNADNPEEATRNASIFSTSLPSLFDTHGLLALSQRQTYLQAGGHVDSSSYRNLENWFNTRYQGENTSESAAARWYLDMYEKTAIGGHVFNNQDIERGEDLLLKWSSDVSNRQKANAPGWQEEYKAMMSFKRRIEEMRGEWGMSEEKLQQAAETYEALAQQNGNDPIYAGYAKVFRNVLEKNKKGPTQQELTEQAYAEAQAEIRNERNAEVAAIKAKMPEAMNRQERQDYLLNRAIALRNGESIASGERYPYAWSNLKHWIGNEGTLGIRGMTERDLETGEVIPISARTVNYNKYGSRIEALASILDKTFNSPDDNPSTHIGNMMHSSLETFHKMRIGNTAYTPEQAVEEFRQKFLQDANAAGDDSEIGQLARLGITFEEKDGRIVANGHPLHGNIQKIQNKLDALFGVPDENGQPAKGTFQKLLEYLASDQSSTMAFEGNWINQAGNTEKMLPVFRHVYYDQNGNVVRTETSLNSEDRTEPGENSGETVRTYQTHMLPDLERINNKTGKIQIIDYKSESEGAIESLPQSAYYATMAEELSQRYHRYKQAGNDDMAARYERFAKYGQFNNNGEWESNIEMVSGWDPLTGKMKEIDLTSADGRQQLNEWRQKLNNAYGSLYDALGNDILEAIEMLTPDNKRMREEAKKHVDELYDKAVPREHMNAQQQAELDFFLATYNDDKEKFNRIRKDIYREKVDQGERSEFNPYDRFAMRRDELNRLFSDKAMQAVISNYGNSDMIKSELTDLSSERLRLVSENDRLQIAAAKSDLDKADKNIYNMLHGVKQSDTKSPVLTALQTLEQAEQTYLGLQNNAAYYDGTQWLDQNAERVFKESQAKAADIRKRLFSEGGEVQQYGQKEIANDQRTVEDLIRITPLSSTENLGRRQEQRRESLLGRIAQYNAESDTIGEEIKRNMALAASNPEMLRVLTELQKSKQDSRDKLQEYLNNGGFERDTQTEMDELRWSEGMQMQQQEHRADQALYRAEHMRRGRRTRYNTTMLSRMYMDRENMAHQASEEEWNYRQEEERMRHQLEGLRSQRAGIDESDTAAIGEIDRKIESAEQAMHKYAAAADEAKSRQSELGNQMPILGAAFDTIAQSVSRVTQQLGRRIFQKAIQEAKRFVMEFDASMTEIQTITMKSDEQMQDIRSSTIDRAINLRTSVGNVSQVEAALYRQGLSDTEVADRSEAIIKFATVTGSKVTDATKIITSALQNGLVQSAEEAMDALTALGDSAATTAVEIGKAMQKCAAAAKVAGVSYGELTSMITVMTSTTQLSGTQVGTALNTLFSRLRQVQSTGYVSDKNGDTTDLSTIETALRLAGIDLRSDENTFRSPTEIMYDIARNWGDMSDVQRANITTSVAGVRAGNMFSTLMEGMAEDNGETFAKYLGLSEDSEGITESKYEIAAKSLQASINELKSTFDGLIENLVESGAIKGIVDAITGFVNGLRLITENGGHVVTTIVAITGAVAALTTVIKVLTGDVAGAVVGGTLLLGTLGLGVASGIGNLQANKKTEGQQAVATMEQYNDTANNRTQMFNNLIDDTKKLGKQYDELQSAMDGASKTQLDQNLQKLVTIFPELGEQIEYTTGQLEKWSEIVNGASEAVENIETKSHATAVALGNIALSKTDETARKEFEEEWNNTHGVGFDLSDFTASTEWDLDLDHLTYADSRYSIDKLQELYESDRLDLETKSLLADVLTNDNANYHKLNPVLKLAIDRVWDTIDTERQNATKAIQNSNMVLQSYADEATDRFNDEAYVAAQTKYQERNANKLQQETIGSNAASKRDTIIRNLQQDIADQQKYIETLRTEAQSRSEALGVSISTDLGEEVDYDSLIAEAENKLKSLQAILTREERSNENITGVQGKIVQEATDKTDLAYRAMKTLDAKWNKIDENRAKATATITKNEAILETLDAVAPMSEEERFLNFAQGNDTTQTAHRMLETLYMYQGDKASDFFKGATLSNGLTLDQNTPFVSGSAFADFIINSLEEVDETTRTAFIDYFNESVSEGGILYLLAEQAKVQWTEFIKQQFERYQRSQFSGYNSTDQEMSDAIWQSYLSKAAAAGGYDPNTGTFTDEFVNDINARTLIGDEVRKEFESRQSDTDYLRTNNPGALHFSVGGQPFRSLDEAVDYLRGVAQSEEAMRDGWRAELGLGDILYDGKKYYQSPEDVFAGLWTEYVQENPDLSGKRLDLLNIANGATGFQEFMSGISGTLGVTWARDNMSKVLPKELYSALQATSEGKLDWPIFQQMLQNYQIGQKGYGYDLNQAILTGEGGIGATFMSAMQSNDQAGMLAEYQRLSGDAVSFDVFKTALESYDGGSEILDKLSRGAQVTEEDIQKLNNAIGRDGAAALGNWSKAMERGRQNVEQLTGEASDVNDFFNSMNANLTKVANNQWFRDQWKAGKRSKNVLEQISAQTGFGVELLNDNKWVKENKGVLEKRLKQAEQADLQTIENYSNTLAQGLQDQLNDGSLSIDLSQVQVGTDGSISIDLSGVADATSGEMSSQMQLIMDQLKAWGINATLHVQTEGEGDGAKYTAWVEIDDTSLGDIIKKRPSGGGGGGGKSHAQQLIESQKHSASVDDHMLKMIQYRRTRYKNAGELTNENTLIKQENEERRRQIKNQRDNISALRDEMAATKQGSDDWYALRDAIQAAEEAIQEHTQAIHDNLEQMKENRKQIRQYKVDIQDMISAELDNREELRRQRLQGTVDMEDTILDIIKQRYRDEWDLLKQDIDNKKAALEQEKSLIDERLNARKNAANEASKYEELANLQAQLSRVEMDSSRTREAAELRDKIAKLQDEIAWKIADQEADAQKADIDERIMGYDLYTDQYQEWLDNYLEDNNNFTTELNDVLKKSREDLIEWLKENDKTYADSTKEQQELMVQNWGDMYDEMKGLTDQYWRDYWNQVAAVMTDRESFMDFMMDSEEYRTASNDRKRQLREQWNEAWSLWSTAKLGGAALVSEEHAGEHDGDDIDDEPKYKFKRSWEVIKKNGSVRASGVAEGDAFYTKKYAKLAAKQLAEEQAMDRKHVGDKVKYGKVEKAYAQGGLVDFTGPAWVDGSKTKPEAFLSAEDTAAMRAFLDAFSMIRVPSFSSMISDSMFSDVSGFTVEKLNIEINEAELKEDPDYEEVARKVGEEFVKELSKQGLQTANFAFSS